MKKFLSMILLFGLISFINAGVFLQGGTPPPPPIDPFSSFECDPEVSIDMFLIPIVMIALVAIGYVVRIKKVSYK